MSAEGFYNRRGEILEGRDFSSIKHACVDLAVYFPLCVSIAFLCSTIPADGPSGPGSLPVTERVFILTAASGFSLTEVLHTLAYSFFAPTIYVWIICHKRVCADEILSLCVFNFFERGKEKLSAFHCRLRVSFGLRSPVCVYTVWRMIWSNCAVFMFTHQSLIK